MDLAALSLEAEAGQRPRHGMWLLSQKLQAQIHQPKDLSVAPLDRLRAKIIRSPESWALARMLASQLNAEDCVFCTSESGGLQLVAACGDQRDRPKIAVFTHNLDRPRGRVALKLWWAADRADLFLACSRLQTDFLQQYLNIPPVKASFIWDHTDTQFFTPGAPAAAKKRPQIVSVGLEQRDYRTLAAATADLDVDTRISGFSQDASALSKAFPEQMPANMSRQFYAWPDLLKLYRSADVVVISLYENRYAAGVQVLMEAMACQRPVVVTATAGLQDYLDEKAMTIVQPGNSQQLRQAILQLLEQPADALSKAQQGYEIAQQRHRMERYIEDISHHLQAL